MSRAEDDDPLRAVLPELRERWDDRGVSFRARRTRTLLGFLGPNWPLLMAFVAFAFMVALSFLLSHQALGISVKPTTGLMLLFSLPLALGVVFGLVAEWVGRPLEVRIEPGRLQFGREEMISDDLLSVTRDGDRLELVFRDGRRWTSPGIQFKDPYRVVHLLRATVPPPDEPRRADLEEKLTEKLAALRGQATEVNR